MEMGESSTTAAAATKSSQFVAPKIGFSCIFLRFYVLFGVFGLVWIYWYVLWLARV
jgi:hypothetical protein